MFEKVIHYSSKAQGFGRQNLSSSWLSVLNFALFFIAVGIFILAFPILVSALLSTIFFMIGGGLVLVSLKTRALGRAVSEQVYGQNPGQAGKAKVILHED